MDAETAYFFRHAIMRDAAYSLHLPSDRAALHRSALELIEKIFGEGDEKSLDPFAMELSRHAAAARKDSRSDDLLEKELNYLYRAALHAEHNDDYRTAVELFKRLHEHPGVDETRRAESALGIGGVLYLWFQDATAKDYLESAVKLGQEAGLPLTEARAQILLGQLANMEGRPADVGARMKAALEFEEVLRREQPTAIVQAYITLARLYMADGNLDDAEGVLDQAWEVATKIDDPEQVPTVLSSRSILYRAQGRHEEALNLVSEAVELARREERKRSESIYLTSMANQLNEMGDAAGAEKASRRAIELAREIGNRRGEAVAMNNLANQIQSSGRFDEAEELMLRVLATARDIGYRVLEGVCRANLGGLLAETDRLPEGIAAYTEAIETLESAGQTVLSVLNHCRLAAIRVRAGDVQMGLSEWREFSPKLEELAQGKRRDVIVKNMRAVCTKAGVAFPATD
jgi:tetratricopeptide (TPR) repeat protein